MFAVKSAGKCFFSLYPDCWMPLLRSWLYRNKTRVRTAEQTAKLKALDIDWTVEEKAASVAAKGKRKVVDGENRGSGPAKKKKLSRQHIHTWDERYEQLKAFKQKCGHVRVPASKDCIGLWTWLYRCKRCKNGPTVANPQLTVEQIDKLDELGVDWTISGRHSGFKR